MPNTALRPRATRLADRVRAIANIATVRQHALMRIRSWPAAVLLILFGCSSTAMAGGVPAIVLRQLPPHYAVISSAAASIGPSRKFLFLALASTDESSPKIYPSRKPSRPLLIFESKNGARYVLAGRNDSVILRADDGGINQCDPFEARVIAVKGRYFTVENGVACGAHWTDNVTFRFEPRTRGDVFDNWRVESWSMNPGTGPNTQALVPDGRKVVRANGMVQFANWHRHN